MKLAIRVHVEELPENVYLGTFENVPGLIAQGRTVAETLEIARDVARKLLEARQEREQLLSFAHDRGLPGLYDRGRDLIGAFGWTSIWRDYLPA